MSKLSSTNEYDKNLISQRLQKIREETKLSQKRFSDELGISLRAYQNYERGERNITQELICTLFKVFNVDPVWILTGEGNMYRLNTASTNFIEAKMQKVMSELTEEQRQDVIRFAEEKKRLNEIQQQLSQLQKQA